MVPKKFLHNCCDSTVEERTSRTEFVEARRHSSGMQDDVDFAVAFDFAASFDFDVDVAVDVDVGVTVGSSEVEDENQYTTADVTETVNKPTTSSQDVCCLSLI